MSNNQRRDQGKQNQNNQKRPFEQGQRDRINPNQRPDRGFNREAAGRDEWRRPEKNAPRPNQGNQGGQGGRQQPGQGQNQGNRYNPNHEDRR